MPSFESPSPTRTDHPAAADPDQLLDSLVRPAPWTNPEPKPLYDLVVIGGGTAGLVTAVGAAGLGARVALVERHRLGGDCLNTGCVPSKALIRSARVVGEIRRGPALGVHAGTVRVDFAAVMTRMRQRRAGLAPHDSAARLTSLGIDVFFGEGGFADERTIAVSSRRLRFRRAVIATGSRPALPPIEGLSGVPYLTNENIFDLTSCPATLAVIGAGPIGCELSQAFARLGAKVTLFDQSPRVLPNDDPDASRLLEQALNRDGVQLALGVRIAHAARTSDGITLRFTRGQSGQHEEVASDQLLVAAGRQSDVSGLAFGRAGIHTSARGPLVDDRLRTTNGRVFAAGDVCSPLMLTHAADAMARLVIQNALFFGRRRASKLAIPWCTYTEPEVAHVGLTAARASETGAQTLTLALSESDRAVLDEDTEGFLRVHHRSGSILGCTIVSSKAGDLIGLASGLVTRRASLGELAATIFPYPTQAELFRKAGDAFRRTRLTPLVQRMFQRYLELTRW